jgi:hypothetical protein
VKCVPIGVVFLLCFFGACFAYGEVKETPHYDVVNAYIRSLGTIHNIQQLANREFEEDKGADDENVRRMMSAIRNSTRLKLELNTSIHTLQGMQLRRPFETLLPTTIEFYKQKIDLHNELVQIAKTFVDLIPKPSVDYSKLVARIPEITAELEYIDESIFKTIAIVFALLIDENPDAEGHMSHLNITKSEKDKLINDIDTLFGESLDKQNRTWTVSSAALLKAYLLKGYKCRDEWQ